MAWEKFGDADNALIFVFVKGNSVGIFIIRGISPAEADFIGWTEAAVAVFLLPLCLLFDGQAGERNDFQTGLRNLAVGDFADSIGSSLDSAERLLDLVRS